jgi:malonate-semialdehyde dehydrogenase (acetylating) / methylmalonate-semialdehyde dehydrogenase
MTMYRVASLMAEAGVPPGVGGCATHAIRPSRQSPNKHDYQQVFQIVNGTAEAVTSLVDHPDVAAVTFVGSSKVAELVHTRARALNKRVGRISLTPGACAAP